MLRQQNWEPTCYPLANTIEKREREKNPESGKLPTPQAYTLSGIFEIPEGQYEVLTCESMDEVIMLSMRANAAHGNQNSVEDRVLMMNKLIQMDEKRFMKNAFMVNIKEVMAALQITRDQARAAVDPKNDELKVRRNAAILELHKDGKKFFAIDTALGLGNGTAKNVVEATSKNGLGPKIEVHGSSPIALPMANTEDRPDTRVDADAFVDDFLSEYDDYISLAEDETESEPAPTFDLKAATGFGDDKEASLRSPSAHHRNIKALMTLGGVYISHAKHKASGTSLRLRA